ncbi:MFS transporter [Microbacterium sorbitolivorans]|uniref:MFS transporter n=2 Tax=Microbacterium sorbitolivorans TaxID=1867410 RepID=A0A367Y615_9MICO|nr:MFS transporter [Microbacterium sorbitolivorans]
MLWGIQASFLSPALALILVDLFDATTAEVGWVLAAYNASGFVFSLLIPALADRRRDYLGPMLLCGVLTCLLAGALSIVTTIPLAAIALIVLAGPAGVGSSLLYAHLRATGARPADVVNTRAIFSVAWIAGPPLATFIMGSFGTRAILVAIAAVAILGMATTAAMMRGKHGGTAASGPKTEAEPGEAVGKLGIVLIVLAFVLLQAGNFTGMSIMAVYVTETLHIDIIWAGIALGVAAALEVPALLIIGRIGERVSPLVLIATSCLAGIAYYAGVAFATGPVALIALQILNAWAFAGIAGVGLTLFQQLIPRPGLSTGIFQNTRRIGAIVAGPVIAIGAMTALEQRGIFVACAIITAVALVVIALAARASGRRAPR